VSQVGARRSANFVSPELQREEMEAWARYRGVEILRFHTDLDQSGATLERPALAEALRRAESGESEGIVVARLDRFARNLTGALATIGRLEAAGAAFVSVGEGLDPTTPAGKMLMRVMLLTAEFELDGIRRSWDQSRRAAVSRGMHLSSVPPTGYRRGPGGRLVLDPASAPHLAEVFRMRAAHRSWPEIHAHVAATDLKNPFGTARWTTASLIEVLGNRAYLGEARCGPHRNRSAHEPLIDRGTWELCRLTRTLTATRSAHPALLSGLLRCAGCVHLLASEGRPAAGSASARKYRCKDHAPGGCPLRPQVRGAEIEELVVRWFFETYGRSPLRRAASAGALARAEAALGAREAELDALEADGAPGVEEEGAETASSRAAVAAARERLIGLARSRLIAGPTSLARRWPAMAVGERRRNLALLIDAVVIREDRGLELPDRVLIMPFGQGPRQLPVRGKAIRLAPITWADACDQGRSGAILPGDGAQGIGSLVTRAARRGAR
jgi:DNA invertase Pin-like site-specific DNA recombinase